MPEAESSVIVSNRCRHERSLSSKVITGVTGMDNTMKIPVNIRKEQRCQRENVRTLQACVSELNYCTDAN